MSEIPDGLVLREVLTYGPGEHRFYPGEYPWLTKVGIHAKGGNGGQAADGTPGEPGTYVDEFMTVYELGRHLLPGGYVLISCGAGGRAGGPGAGKGDDGLVVLELYSRADAEDCGGPGGEAS